MVAATLAQKCKVLAGVSLFESLAESDLEAIARVAIPRNLKAREELFHKGDTGSQLYVVASGQLKAITTSRDGDDLMFCVFEPGEVFGEIGLFGDLPRTATISAIKASELLAIDRRDLRALLSTRPDVAFELLKVMARRVARVSEFIEDTHFLNLPVRLAKRFIDFANTHGKVSQGKAGPRVLIDVKLSQEEWGDLVGTTRESINKQFRAWTRDGLISLESGKVVIHELKKLETLAGCVAV